MTALRYLTAGWFAGCLGYALVTGTWWVAFTVTCAVLAWLPSTQSTILVMRMEDDDG